MDPAHEEERRRTVKRLVTTLVCAGLLLTLSPAAAQWDDDWNKVNVLAARWVHDDGAGTVTPKRVEILKWEEFHDTAIVTDGEELEWELKCIQFDQNLVVSDCAGALEFAIVDFHFVVDLDSISEDIASEVIGIPENQDFTGPVELKRGKKRAAKFSKNFKDHSQANTQGKGWGQANGANFKSGPTNSDFSGGSQLWKYTIVVEDPLAVPPDHKNCLKFGAGAASDEAHLSPPECCDDSALCDIWDPHVYTHGGRHK